MAKMLNDWIDTDVQPYRKKPVAWLAQHRVFRDPMRPTFSDLSYFFPSADGVILYQRKVGADEYLIKHKTERR